MKLSMILYNDFPNPAKRAKCKYLINNNSF